MRKTSFLTFLGKNGLMEIFPKSWAKSVLRYYNYLQADQKSEKTNDPILTKPISNV